MKRECTGCARPFTRDDLAREETQGMEAERKQAGLEGIRFLYCRCPACGMDDIFVDVLPQPGESPEGFRARRDEMESVVRRLHGDRVQAVVVPLGE
jgi:hypothetical protein